MNEIKEQDRVLSDTITEMKEEVLPKNILMIGPTGVGKTEISRRLSKLAEAPFVKVEATRFTEVGYVGRDVEQIVRDLIQIAIGMEKVKMRKEVHAQAQKAAEEGMRQILNLHSLDELAKLKADNAAIKKAMEEENAAMKKAIERLEAGKA